MILIFFAAAALLLYILQAAYKRSWPKELSAELSFDGGYIYEDDESAMYEVIENRKRLPVFLLEVGFKIGRGISFIDTENTNVSDYVYKRDIYALGGYERITRTIRLVGKGRGYFPVSDVSLSAFSLFHTKRYLCQAGQDAAIYVYAKRTALGRIVPALDSILGEEESRRKFLEDPFAFSSIRDYTISDPMKSINWKASARSGELMVNTYASTMTARLMVLLDIEDSGIWKRQELVEDSIRVAATLLQRYLAAGREAGLAVNAQGTEVIMPGKGGALRHRAERLLTADFEKERPIPVQELFRHVPEDVIPVVISKNADRELVLSLTGAFGSERRVLLVVPHGKDEKPVLPAGGGIETVFREVLS